MESHEEKSSVKRIQSLEELARFFDENQREIKIRCFTWSFLNKECADEVFGVAYEKMRRELVPAANGDTTAAPKKFIENAWALLRTVVTHAATDWRRRNKRFVSRKPPMKLRISRSVVDEVILTEMSDELRSALDSISPDSAKIIIDIYYADRSQRDVARELGLVESTVSLRKVKALDELRKHLASQFQDPKDFR